MLSRVPSALQLVLISYLLYMCLCSLPQPWQTLCDPMDHSPPGSSFHKIFQARILEPVAISFSRGSCWPSDQTWVSCIGRWNFCTAPPGKPILCIQISSVQLLSPVWLFATPWTAGFPVHHQLPELAQIHVHWVGDAIQPSYPLSSASPAFSLSQHQGLFQWVSSSHQVAEVLEFQLQYQPSNEYSGMISLRIDWFDLLEVPGTLKSLFKHHNSKASILQRSAFFIVQISHPYMTTRKTITLTRWTFISKVMPLLFNKLSRLVITFVPRSKCLLISWLQSPSAVILEPKKTKSVAVSMVSPSMCHEVMGLDAMIFVFLNVEF